MSSKGPDPTPPLRPGDRCECGLMVSYGEIFHRDSPAHRQAMKKKMEMEAAPPSVVYDADSEGNVTPRHFDPGPNFKYPKVPLWRRLWWPIQWRLDRWRARA